MSRRVKKKKRTQIKRDNAGESAKQKAIAILSEKKPKRRTIRKLQIELSVVVPKDEIGKDMRRRKKRNWNMRWKT